MSDNRETAVQIILETFQNRSFLNFDLMNKYPDTDRGFIKMLTMTTTRRYEFLRKVLKQFLRKKLPDKADFADKSLLCGACELLFMDTPDYAVINSYVNLVKKHCDKYIGGMVNAILRKISAEKDTLLAHDNGEFFSAPFFEILNLDYPQKTIRAMQQLSLKEPPLAITVKQNPQLWSEKLSGTYLDGDTILLPNAKQIRSLEGYSQGEWWIQDYAASLAVSTLPNISGKRVLDLCAAPGGKTAQLINRGAVVTSLDNSQQRLKTLRENMQRLGFTPQQIICADALHYLNEFNDKPFDVILLDAPCSGTGVFRRHPELVHIKNRQDTIRQAELQKQILSLAVKALKPEGTLVYCTCSVAKIEGEQQIHQFLAEYPEFQIIPLQSKHFPQIITPEGFIRTLPTHLADFGGCDSFFVAHLKKGIPCSSTN